MDNAGVGLSSCRPTRVSAPKTSSGDDFGFRTLARSTLSPVPSGMLGTVSDSDLFGVVLPKIGALTYVLKRTPPTQL